MQKARYKYRVEVNRWTWLAGVCALVFLGIFLFQILSIRLSSTAEVERPLPPESAQTFPVGVYDPTEGTEAFYGPPNPSEGPETSYDAGEVDTWHPPDRIVMESAAPLVLTPEPSLMEAEAADAQKTLVERILELISQILDKLVQLITGTITLMGIWKSIKRVEQKNEAPKVEPKENE